MIRKNRVLIVLAAFGFAAVIVLVFGNRGPKGGMPTHEVHEDAFERGPHRGRLLRDGDLAVEITIFEEGVPPEFHVYAYHDGKPLAPAALQLSIGLSRLGGKQDKLAFTPAGSYLKSTAVVREPHSFDVRVEADYKKKKSVWTYAAYEGRTTITPQATQSAGIVTAVAGPATIRQAVPLMGQIVLNRNKAVEIKARYPGMVREITHGVGDPVAAGEVLARVENNIGRNVYTVTSPMAGVVIERQANTGTLTSDTPLLVVADLSDVWAEFHVFPRDLERIRAGQSVKAESVDGTLMAETTIAALLPVAAASSQSVIARVTIPNPDGRWRPGVMARAHVTVSEKDVPLAVKILALQRLGDFPVVFAKFQDSYEVRRLELGARDEAFAEVLGGLDPGEVYAAENSYLIKADIEKSGADHDH